MQEFEYHFEATLSAYDFGTMAYTVVYLPKSVLSKLDFSRSKRLRIHGEISGVPIEAAIMPSKGTWYIMVSKKLQKKCRLSLGDRALVSFNIADPESITIPRELRFALEANATAMQSWDSLTAGKRRGFCYRVDSAKRMETRQRRVADIIEMLVSAR